MASLSKMKWQSFAIPFFEKRRKKQRQKTGEEVLKMGWNELSLKKKCVWIHYVCKATIDLELLKNVHSCLIPLFMYTSKYTLPSCHVLALLFNQFWLNTWNEYCAKLLSTQLFTICNTRNMLSTLWGHYKLLHVYIFYVHIHWIDSFSPQIYAKTVSECKRRFTVGEIGRTTSQNVSSEQSANKIAEIWKTILFWGRCSKE